LTVGRAAGSAHPNASVTVARVPALLREDALAQLAVLVDLYDRGMNQPLPLACRTSAAFASGGNARGEWESDRFPKEDREPEHELVFGSRSFAALLEEAPREDERWDPVERSRFGQYALRLWHGLLFHEAVTDE
jgi:exodeoxyribonuclease V gamma subunit